MTYQDSPVLVTAAGYAIPRTAWALVRDGFIAAVVHTYDEQKPPFKNAPVAGGGVPVPMVGEAAIRVTGTGALMGHLVDSFGNVTPAEGRTTALQPGQAAYHDGAGVDIAVANSEPATPEPEDTEPAAHGETNDEQAEQSAKE
ncbi:protein naked cuticle homolog 2 [Acetobacter orientalis]|uniref:Protein naked cuticle homolog 2 n=1 Tax=Acetobacter orientalis TaxID=146474 RepID=A0A2Z5ZKX9_9PROT|nr:protein naked cuticle homolog 2 [Acetobacter orientalis]